MFFNQSEDVYRVKFYEKWLRVRNRAIREHFEGQIHDWLHVEQDNEDLQYPHPLFLWKPYVALHPNSTTFEASLAYGSPLFTPPFPEHFATSIDLAQVNRLLDASRQVLGKRKREN